MKSILVFVAVLGIHSSAFAQSDLIGRPNSHQPSWNDAATVDVQHAKAMTVPLANLDSGKECFAKLGLTDGSTKVIKFSSALIFYSKEEVQNMIAELQKLLASNSCLK